MRIDNCLYPGDPLSGFRHRFRLYEDTSHGLQPEPTLFLLLGTLPMLINRRRILVVAGFSVLITVATGLIPAEEKVRKSPPKGGTQSGVAKGKPVHRRARAHLQHYAPTGGMQILVAPGTENEARQYYTDIEQELGVELGDFSAGGTDRSTIDDLLKYLGYQKASGEGLKANDLETTDSDVLMSFEKFKLAYIAQGRNPEDLATYADGDVLAARWFAPKITDVAVPLDLDIDVGWRKLVRLRPLPASTAESKGIEGMYLLFNVFSRRSDIEGASGKSPFLNRSLNNQVILTRKSGSVLTHASYFLVFGKVEPDKAKTGEIIFALNASFDFRHPDHVPENKAYFVPTACAQCHGAEFTIKNGKLNYLDTDHWFYRIGAQNDFPFMSAPDMKFGVVFDGGKDTSTPEFANAFGVIRTLNQEIEAQNQTVDAGNSSFSLRSVKTWLSIHATSVDHIALSDDLDRDGFLDRSILGDPGTAGEQDRWRKNDRIDEALLPLLNQYCYRCHSSVRYSIYDRSAIRLRSSDNAQRLMQRYLTDILTVPNQKVPFMPQDRLLPAAQRNSMVDLLDRMLD